MIETTLSQLMLALAAIFLVVATILRWEVEICRWWANVRWNWRYALQRKADNLCIWLAWHVLPKRLVMWCAMRVGAHATTGQYSATNVPQLTFMEAAKRWESA